MDRGGQKGITLVELIVVIAVVAVISAALFPLVSSTYESWRAADRRVELLRVGRTAMDKITREVRKAYDLRSATAPLFINFYPDWASSTLYRVNYDNTNYMQFEFGTQTPVFINDSLAAPIDSYTYTTYSRRLENGVSARRVNAFKLMFTVSDERRILPNKPDLNLNPMTFFSQAQMRTAREGYNFSRTNAYATDTYRYRRGPNDPICVKTWCDRIDPALGMTTQTVTLALIGFGFSVTYNLNYKNASNGDYFEKCPINSNLFLQPSVLITIALADASGQKCDFQDAIRVDP